MKLVTPKHDIVTADRFYKAGVTVDDMPEGLIEEMLPLKALVVIEERLEQPVVKRRYRKRLR